MITKRLISFAASLALLTGGLVAAEPPVAQPMTVYKTPTCGCCGKWVDHMRANGFTVVVKEVDSTEPIRKQFGVPEKLASCHTGIIAGYAVEGHVPAAEVRRMLKEKPKGKGIAVPGMPLGSPGMEQGSTKQTYWVLLFDGEGATKEYQRYPLP
ncbi:MAG: DUF411 domain-containing protein [Bryobacteraceae bacterium]|nr:DUF411 domain-containing protein [Bryobacteraceae bacterium]